MGATVKRNIVRLGERTPATGRRGRGTGKGKEKTHLERMMKIELEISSLRRQERACQEEQRRAEQERLLAQTDDLDSKL